MRVTFSDLWEAMNRSESPLMDSGESTEAHNAIRAGLDLHPDEDRSFWDDFMDVCSNSQGMAELLDVRPEQVASWAEKIRQRLDDVEKSDAENPSKDVDTEMLPTGDTGAVVTPSNMDPFLGAL